MSEATHEHEVLELHHTTCSEAESQDVSACFDTPHFPGLGDAGLALHDKLCVPSRRNPYFALFSQSVTSCANAFISTLERQQLEQQGNWSVRGFRRGQARAFHRVMVT